MTEPTFNITKRFLFLLVVFVYFASCKSGKRVPLSYYQPPQMDFCDTCEYKNPRLISNPKSIIIDNDSVLNYSERFGGIGKATTLKYSVDENILIIDSIDIYGNSTFSELSKGVFNERYFFYRDSLVNVETGEKYLSNEYLKQLEKQRKKEKTYFIINGKKYKVNKINIRRKFKFFDTN